MTDVFPIVRSMPNQLSYGLLQLFRNVLGDLVGASSHAPLARQNVKNKNFRDLKLAATSMLKYKSTERNRTKRNAQNT